MTVLDLNQRHAQAMMAFEKAYFTRLIELHAPNVKNAANSAGISATQIYRKLSSLQIQIPRAAL